MNTLDQGFVEGYACLSARADLLDRINVFPVADGDTGANLRISLGPLRSCSGRRPLVAGQLCRTATGNSGNIAVSFFGELLRAAGRDELPEAAARGRDKAWQAVADPKDGTMLNVFDTLAERLAALPLTGGSCPGILAALQQEVLTTASILPDLHSAGVVDAGALGMYVFFDGFFRAVTGYADRAFPLADLFPGRLAISEEFCPGETDGYCVDVLIRPAGGRPVGRETAAAWGESVVVLPDQEKVKIHLHTSDPQELRRKVAEYGEIVTWSDASLRPNPEHRLQDREPPGCIHIMTDAAGSLSRQMARRHGITLLDSYIVSGDTAGPESLISAETVYARMRAGKKVTTAQASIFERHQMYRSVCEQHGRTLYLCVGSAFTGNFTAATDWKLAGDACDQLDIVDTGAASGRLGVIALLCARYAATATEEDRVLSYARFLVESCREYVFIDALRYLVAGGRLSRTGGFLGDLLHMKPVVSPMPEGVKRVGLVRDHDAQLAFAEEKLRLETVDWERVLVLLQYSDNEEWVNDVVLPRIRICLPRAEMVVAPLSLTSGVHMGPGTWSVAFGPVI